MTDSPHPETRYHLRPEVGVRQESFGVLSYDYSSRSLQLLPSPFLAEIVMTCEDVSFEELRQRLGVRESDTQRLRVGIDFLVKNRIIDEFHVPD